jgi:hypothetical protein
MVGIVLVVNVWVMAKQNVVTVYVQVVKPMKLAREIVKSFLRLAMNVCVVMLIMMVQMTVMGMY